MKCSIYSDLNTCSQCDPDYFLADNKCLVVTSPVAACKIHQNEEECQECEEGFYLRSPNDCVTNEILHCETQISRTACQKCKPNYVLARIDSALVCKFSNIQNCLVAIGGQVVTCNKCQSGFVPSSDKKSCIQPSGIQQCAEYKSFNSCSRCNSGYIRNDSCNQCLDRTSVTGNALGTTNCVSEFIPKKPVCDMCKPGYLKNDEGKCVACKANGCAICNLNNDKCQVCREGFYMNSNMVCLLNSGRDTEDKSAFNIRTWIMLIVTLLVTVKY
jgi:hypothetical protein